MAYNSISRALIIPVVPIRLWNGYGFFPDRQLVMIFCSPNCCGEFYYADEMMSVDESLMYFYSEKRTYKNNRVSFIFKICVCDQCVISMCDGCLCTMS